MGKRKKAAKKPTGPKRNAPLPTLFDCLFCNHPNAVSVKLDKKAGVGQLSCKTCNQQFQCAVNYLSAAVDVYSDWVDACDAVAKEAEEGGGRGGGDYAPSSRPSARTSAGRARDEEEDDENDIIDDRDDDGYGGEGIVADDDDY